MSIRKPAVAGRFYPENREETPIPGSIFVLVDKSSEISLRQKHCKLSKEVMSGMHNLSILNMGAKVPNSNVGHTFLNLKCCA